MSDRTKYMREWYFANKERTAERRHAASKRWYAGNKERSAEQSKTTQLRLYYGITPQQKDRMVEDQSGKCAICQAEFKSTRTTHVDHCHETGEIRAILCHSCNVKLGRFEKQSARVVPYIDGPRPVLDPSIGAADDPHLTAKQRFDRNRNLVNKYGVTSGQKDNLIARQGGLCLVCEDPFKSDKHTHLDHCHNSRDIRGVLCHWCNIVIGWYERHRNRVDGYLLGDFRTVPRSTLSGDCNSS